MKTAPSPSLLELRRSHRGRRHRTRLGFAPSGVTPLHRAGPDERRDTGRPGTGIASVIERQRGILLLLLDHGAVLTDEDGRGKTAIEAARTPWIRELLAGYTHEQGHASDRS